MNRTVFCSLIAFFFFFVFFFGARREGGGWDQRRFFPPQRCLSKRMVGWPSSPLPFVCMADLCVGYGMVVAVD